MNHVILVLLVIGPVVLVAVFFIFLFLYSSIMFFFFFFFFQAEDGIRDGTVTGVQTCALPISEERQEIREVADPDRVRMLASGRQRDLEVIARVVEGRREQRPALAEKRQPLQYSLDAVIAAAAHEAVLDAVGAAAALARAGRRRAPDQRLVPV